MIRATLWALGAFVAVLALLYGLSLLHSALVAWWGWKDHNVSFAMLWAVAGAFGVGAWAFYVPPRKSKRPTPRGS